MAIDGDMEYALARVQAQYGRRLGESDWRRLEASLTLGQFLDALRSSALADWIVSLDRTHDSHAIERTLRGEWRHYVQRVAAWHPMEWQPWIAWLAWLPTLSLLAQLARAEPAPSWLMADAICGPIAPGPLADRVAALKGTILATFEPAMSGRATIGSLWRTRWLSLQPRAKTRIRPHIDGLLRAVDSYARELTKVNGDGTAVRNQLVERLTKLFRTSAGTAVATICHLGLIALELERLRGGLVSRCALAPRG